MLRMFEQYRQQLSSNKFLSPSTLTETCLLALTRATNNIIGNVANVSLYNS